MFLVPQRGKFHEGLSREKEQRKKNGPKKNGDVVVASEKKDDDGYDSVGVLLAIGTQTNGK